MRFMKLNCMNSYYWLFLPLLFMNLTFVTTLSNCSSDIPANQGESLPEVTLIGQQTKIYADLIINSSYVIENEVLTLLWVGFERRDAQDNQLADLYEVRYLYDGDAIRRIKNVTTWIYDSDGNLLDLCSSNLTVTVARNIADLNIGSDNLSLDISLTAVVNDVENAKSFNISPRAVTDS